MGQLIEFAFDDTKPADVQLKAIQNSLDRAGLKPPAEVVLSQGETKPPYEELFEGIAPMSRAESRAARGYVDPAPPPASAVADMASQYASEPSDAEAQAFSQSGSPREPEPHSDSRERESGGREQPRSQRVQHITGMLAIEEANRANRAIGALPDPSAAARLLDGRAF